MVIDDAVTLMGSMNWTASAARNSEDLNLVALPTVGYGLYAGLGEVPHCRPGQCDIHHTDGQRLLSRGQHARPADHGRHLDADQLSRWGPQIGYTAKFELMMIAADPLGCLT